MAAPPPSLNIASPACTANPPLMDSPMMSPQPAGIAQEVTCASMPLSVSLPMFYSPWCSWSGQG